MADIADQFTRNEILTSNEIRQVIGIKPSKDPNADELRNKNLSQPNDNNAKEFVEKESKEEIQNEEV